MDLLKDKVVLVTGGSAGIGRAAAHAFADVTGHSMIVNGGMTATVR